MSQNRFVLLLHMIHFNNNDTAEEGNRLSKLELLSQLLEQKFQKVYSLGKEIGIDDIIVPWCGSLLFKQYISGKKYKYGDTLFEIVDPKGYTGKIILYSGKSEYSQRGLAESGSVFMSRA